MPRSQRRHTSHLHSRTFRPARVQPLPRSFTRTHGRTGWRHTGPPAHARPDGVGRVCRATRAAVRKPARAADRARMRAADKPRRGQEAPARRTARAWLCAHARVEQRQWTARAVDTTRTAVHAAAADSAPTRAANSAVGQRARRTPHARRTGSPRAAHAAAADSARTRRTAHAPDSGPMRTADSKRTRRRRIVRPRARRTALADSVRGGQEAHAQCTQRRQIRAHAAAVDSAPMRAADSAGGQRARRIRRSREWRTGSPRAAAADSAPTRTVYGAWGQRA
ncbi:hypothetical protein GGX14DRAFT_385943 [Mycena pura]|uniref:Uncharacterized protein n=1 Tax=Mycena pura TaxID=153505 RepID=A0AAD6YRR2_9AGAR|nr:hypothetical protein GGX14DRAFT_385943 [Mycena pura]